jgi:trimethylamine--corrinoid protein Co-methyltransferase
VVLYDQDGARRWIGGSRVHFDPGSAAVTFSTMAAAKAPRDVGGSRASARLVDRLPMRRSRPARVFGRAAQIGDRYRLYLGSQLPKPIVTGTLQERFRADAGDAGAIRGGKALLAESRRHLRRLCQPAAQVEQSHLPSLIDSARAMIPAEVIPMPLTGATSPVTLRATVVQHCAEGLWGLVIHQLARPGAPFVFGGACSAFDMRAGSTPMGAIETMLLASAYAQVGRQLGLPTHGYFVVSDAKTVDYQAGLESGIRADRRDGGHQRDPAQVCSTFADPVAGKIVLDHEACGMALRAIRGSRARGGMRWR